MKRLLTRSLCAFILTSIVSGTLAQQVDLKYKMKHNGIRVCNRTMTVIKEKGYYGLRLTKEYGEGVAWIEGVDFGEGEIEFDVRGENVAQHSFVGIAFHAVNDSTFESVYLRPFHFPASLDELKKRMVQYISLPEYTWRKLRADSPGVYEGSIAAPPDPDSWVHMRVVVDGGKVSTYINNSPQPSLEVNSVTDVKRGMIGFYVADTSGGDFANLKVTPRK